MKKFSKKKSWQSKKIKCQIEEIVSKNGCYVLFTTQDLNTKQKNERVSEFELSYTRNWHENYDTVQLPYLRAANLIKDWVNENIAAVTLVQKYNDITRPRGFRIWKEWGRDIKADENVFETNKTVEENIKLIKEAIKTENVIRIVGHSGLGKTRLVYEAFKPSNEKESIANNKYCLLRY